MVKNLFKIISAFCLILSTTALFGQVEFIVSEEVVTPGTAQVEVEVSVKNFTDISGAQFSISYDTMVIKNPMAGFANPNVADLSSGNLGLPSQSGSLEEGEITFTFYNGDIQQSLPDESVLFSLVFDVVGSEGQSSAVSIVDVPTYIEVFDIDFNEYEVTVENGSVTIMGQPGEDDIIVTAGMVTAESGASVCVPMTATNFRDTIVLGSGTILFDDDLLDFTGIQNIHPELSANSMGNSSFFVPEPGKLVMSWIKQTNDLHIFTIPDGGKLFDVCFDVTGEAGSMSVIDLREDGNLPFSWRTDNRLLPSGVVDGKVTIQEGEPTNVTFLLEDANILKGSTKCLDMTVKNFTDIYVMQFTMKYDGDKLEYKEAKGTSAIPEINPGLFGHNEDNNEISFALGADEGKTLADDTAIFQVCFEAIGECDDETTVEIGSFNGATLEVTQECIDCIVENVGIDDSDINIICEPDCEVVRIDKTCAGSSNGNVIVNIDSDCSCTWTDESGTVVSQGTGSACNLLNVGVGTYSLVVECPGEQPGCSLTATVEAFPEIGVDGTVTDAGCEDKGSITITTAADGDYSYVWNPEQTGTTTITDLDPGTYSVTVTDNATRCTETKSFEVKVNAALDFDNVDVDNVSCAGGSNGSINVTMKGGCGDLTYTWSPNVSTTNVASDLGAGMYTVTVKDSSDPANEVSRTIEITMPDAMSLTGLPTVVNSNGSDGSIAIEVNGGTPPYSYAWSGAAGLPNADMISGLAPGDYSCVVTDANGCTFNTDNITVQDLGGEFVITDVTVNGNGGDFDLLCYGDNNASISGNIEKASLPVKITVDGPEDREVEITSLGAFTIDDLSAGTYNIKLEDADGNVNNFNNIEITEPEKIEIDVDNVECSDSEKCDGEITLEVSGGTGEYTYDWSESGLDGGEVTGLCVGNYTLLLTDENGCQASKNILVQDCSNPQGCYEGGKILTPNGDNKNDYFTITCIESQTGTLYVYDRWGNEVYQNAAYDNSWQGTDADGQDLDEGAYMWVLQVDFDNGTNRIVKGTVTLLR